MPKRTTKPKKMNPWVGYCFQTDTYHTPAYRSMAELREHWLQRGDRLIRVEVRELPRQRRASK